MPSLLFKRLKAGLEDVVAQERRARGARVAPLVPPPDAAKLRKRLGLTQEEMAVLCGVGVATIRSWEHGRRRPRGAAAMMLRIIARDPAEAVRMLKARTSIAAN